MAEDHQGDNSRAGHQLQLEGIRSLAENDILCGRSKQTHHHPGNLSYRGLVNLNKSFYASCEKSHKSRIAQGIVAAIRAQKPPGRFLALDPKTSLYYDIGDKKATEKTSQALREGQPKTLKRIQQELKAEDEGNGMHVPPNITNPVPYNFEVRTAPIVHSHVALPACAGHGTTPEFHDISNKINHPENNRNECYNALTVTSDEHGITSLVNNTILHHSDAQQKRMSSVTVESMSDLISLEALKELQNAIDNDVPKSPTEISIEKDYDVFAGSVSTETQPKDKIKTSAAQVKNPSCSNNNSQMDLCMSMGTAQSSLRSSAFAHDVNQEDLMSITTDMRSLNMSTMGESVVTADIPFDRKIDYEEDSPVYNEHEHKVRKVIEEVLPPPSFDHHHSKDGESEDDIDMTRQLNSILSSVKSKRSHLLKSASASGKSSVWGEFNKGSIQNASILSDFSEMSNMTTFGKQIDSTSIQKSQNFEKEAYVPYQTGNTFHQTSSNVVFHNPDNRRSALARSMSEKEIRDKLVGHPRKNESAARSSLISEFTTMSGVQDYDASEDPYL